MTVVKVGDHEVIPADIIPSSFSVGTALPGGVDITPYGVVGLPDPDDEEAKPLTDNQVDRIWRDGVKGMRGLRDMTDAAFKWTIGDLANYTTKRFSNGRMGELCEEYGISTSVARDCARLARQYDFSQRTQASWSVHRVAAPLESDTRAKLLAESIEEKLTVDAVQAEADLIAGKSKGARPGAKKKAAADEPIKLTESLLARMHERIEMSDKVEATLIDILQALPAHELEVKESGEGQSFRAEVLQLCEALKFEAKHLQKVASMLTAAVKLPKGAKRRVVVINESDADDEHDRQCGSA